MISRLSLSCDTTIVTRGFLVRDIRLCPGLIPVSRLQKEVCFHVPQVLIIAMFRQL